MDENLSHDWISAYVDNELSPEEKAQVEEKLRESPEAMQELFEIRALSGLLTEAVEVDLPPDFSSRVMQQAERESLIGKSPADVAGPQSRSRSWLPIATICSTVACLALVLFLVIPGMLQNDLKDLAETSNTVASDAESSTLSGVLRTGEIAEKTFDEVELTAPSDFGATETEGLNYFSFSAPETETMDLADGTRLKVISPINLKESAEIGDIIRALRMSAGHVAIVELTVVDRQQGIDHLQFILSGESIQGDPSVDRSEVIRGEVEEELYTVFVEAAPAQMQAVLTKMQHDMEFATVEVSTTILADDLEPYFADNGYASLEVNRVRSSYRNSPDETKTVKLRGEAAEKPSPGAGSKPEADTSVAKQPKQSNEVKDAKDESALVAPRFKNNNEKENFRYSRQTLVRLPEKETIELIEQNKLQRESAPTTDSRRSIVADNLNKLPQPKPSALSTAPADEPAAKPAEIQKKLHYADVPEEFPVQVLFVVRLEMAESPLPAPKPSSR